MIHSIKTAILISFILSLFACAKEKQTEARIIPLPHNLEQTAGTFVINEKTKISVLDEELVPLAELLSDKIERISGLQLSIIQEENGPGHIVLSFNPELEKEAYFLEVSDHVKIAAANYNSMAMGLASLFQLTKASNNQLSLPKVSVSDQPDYSYRIVMLDLARFWHPVETIKETIDLLWFYKIPYLHLHLSDNRRVTFPMEEFPDLKTIREDGSREYYTLEELEDMVEYAKQRGIVIIPEIDLPGHSAQLWQKYPEVFGSIDPVTKKAKYLHVVNMAKEETYEACKKIINKLADVFYTSPYIHIGGDEVYLEVIKSIPEYKTFCKKHKLNAALDGDANELFCYFINRMDEMVKATGKKSIIWEGFHGTGAGSQTISKEISVVVWNTTYNRPDSLITNGYKVINSTWIPWYIVGAMNLAASQETSYNWDVTDWSHWDENIEDIKLDSKAGILGGQICFWEQNHFRVIPLLKERVPALAERLWNNTSTFDFTGFYNRYTQTNSIYEKLFNPVKIEASELLSEQDLTFLENANIKLKSNTPGTIKYVYSDSWKLPDMKTGTVYEKAFTISKSGILTVQLFDENDVEIGFPVQQYFQKIKPAYNYKVFGPAPQKGWTKMPDLTQLTVLREGLSGLMTPERLEKINGELFAKVKREGHIEVRFNGIYNPYAVELKGTIICPETEEYQFRIQTHDGLAELYINNNLVGKGEEFANKPEDFRTKLESGAHEITIKYFYKNIQNQLSILYKTDNMQNFEPFEKLIQPAN